MVFHGVIYCLLFGMVSGMQVVTVCDVGMMSRRLLVIACLVLGRFLVMARRMFMMLRRFGMMICALLTHKKGIESFRFVGCLVRLLGPQGYNHGSQ